MPDPVREAAEAVALEWARTQTSHEPATPFRDGPTPDERLAATLLLDLHRDLGDLRKRYTDTQRLAHNLGYDMLYTLEAAFLDTDAEVHESGAAEQILGELDMENLAPEDMLGLAHRAVRAERALLYLTRGWRRDNDEIAAATTTTAHALDEKLPDTSVIS